MEKSYQKQQKELIDQLEKALANGVQRSTVVEMRSDYANDRHICLTSVVFVPDKISKKIISGITDRLKKIEPHHYFYPPESMHLTIKNLRTEGNPPLFTPQDAKKADELFKKIIPDYRVFEFNVEDVLTFPTSLAVMAYSGDAFHELVVELDNGLKKIGLPDNKKYFSNSVTWGNITVCRFTKKPGVKFLNAVKEMRDLQIGKFKVEEIKLIICNAACHPGSLQVIGEYDLKK